VFYANYGRKEDFEYLKNLSVDLKDSIVVVGCGGLFRGIKVRNAEEVGAKGIIIYSDPQDDGFRVGPVYPNGPYRPENSVQRGNVMYPELKGDPTTPGYPSVPGTSRIKREEATNIPQKIVALPMSHKDAKILLNMLDGPKVPESWVGGMEGIEYKIGSKDSKFTVKMNVQNKEMIKPIYNVFVKIRGTIESDREIIIGNHRDAWIFGSVDPHGGTIAFLEVIKSFSELMKTNWRPRRTIVFASWDAEEHGLLGSVEWVEHYSNYLKNNAIAYINLDLISGLHFNVESSPSLSNIVREVSTRFRSPYLTNSTLDKAWGNITNNVGGGSDHVPFFHHLGISVIDLTFRQGATYGVYHSIYENFDYYSRYVDPNYDACEVMSKVIGLIVLRLSTNDLLSFKLKEQSEVLNLYFNKLGNDTSIITFKESLSQSDLILFNNYLSTFGNSLKEFEVSVGKFEKKLQEFIKLGPNQRNYGATLRVFNDKLAKFERSLTKDEGIRGRTWFKHVICSVGSELGYGSEMFPGLMESVRLKNLDLSLRSIEQIISAIRASTLYLTF
jgi:hypothetical protein